MPCYFFSITDNVRKILLDENCHIDRISLSSENSASRSGIIFPLHFLVLLRLLRRLWWFVRFLPLAIFVSHCLGKFTFFCESVRVELTVDKFVEVQKCVEAHPPPPYTQYIVCPIIVWKKYYTSIRPKIYINKESASQFTNLKRHSSLFESFRFAGFFSRGAHNK